MTPPDPIQKMPEHIWAISFRTNYFKDGGWREYDSSLTVPNGVKYTRSDIADELLGAAKAQEKAEHKHANCKECGGEGVPECCEKCFPYFDDARLKRRAAIKKAQGE